VYKILAALLMASITAGCATTLKKTPNIVYHHDKQFLSTYSIPMPTNDIEFNQLVSLADTGNADANWMLAAIYSENNELAKSMATYQRAIDRQDKYQTNAMVNLGIMSAQQKEYKKAFALYQQAADLGNSAGYKELGTSYLLGVGVKRDFDKAKAYYMKGQALGCGECQYLVDNWDAVVALKKQESP